MQLETPQIVSKRGTSLNFAALVGWLIKPNATLVSEEDQQRAKLMAGLLLTTIFSAMLIIAFVVALDPGDIDHPGTIGGAVACLIFISMYFVNRRGHTRMSAIGFVFLTALLFVLIPFAPGSESPEMLSFALVPVLITGMFFSVRMVAFTSGIIIALVYLLNQAIGQENQAFWGLQMEWYFLLFGSALIITFIRHLNTLEQIRRHELEIVNQKLRESEALLEQRVRERTRDLTVAAEVSTQFSSILELPKLLTQVVDLIRSGFELYQVSIYLYQHETNMLSLSASAGTGSAALTTMEFALDGQGLVPKAARERQLVSAANVTGTPDYFPNPKLPESRSEMSVPIVVAGELVGVIDLQSEFESYFSENTVRVMLLLATQLGVAVQNARLYSEAAAARQLAEESNQIKSQFLANMSHELRTPLNAILNFTAFVADGVMGPVNNEQVDALQQAVNSGKHLLSLINDVLDITKIEAGLMDLFIQEVDVNQAINAVVSIAKGLLKDQPVKLNIEIEEHLPLTFGDKRRLRQVFLNIVSNAVKFTREGSVSIRAEAQDNWISFKVTDTGIGIASDDQGLVFETFKQAKHDTLDAVGTGLGMPISKYFVESHGGLIWFESEPGVGSTFYVKLPILTESEANRLVNIPA